MSCNYSALSVVALRWFDLSLSLIGNLYDHRIALFIVTDLFSLFSCSRPGKEDMFSVCTGWHYFVAHSILMLLVATVTPL